MTETYCTDPKCDCTFRNPKRRRLTMPLKRYGLPKGARCIIRSENEISKTFVVDFVDAKRLWIPRWKNLTVSAKQLEPVTHDLPEVEA
jgi:hypothetical protein